MNSFHWPALRRLSHRYRPTSKWENGMSKSSVVKVERYNGITTVIMNRPEKRNAMSPELHVAMDRTLEELEGDPDTKVVVIRGAGGNFSAGQDLKEFFRALEDKPAESKRMQDI